MTMNREQFEVLSKLLRSRGAANEAARLVLVEGLRPSEAAAESGASSANVADAVRRFRDANALIKSAYGRARRGARAVPA